MTLLCGAPGVAQQIARDGRITPIEPSTPVADGSPGCDVCVAALIRDDPAAAPHHRPYELPPAPAGTLQVVEVLVDVDVGLHPEVLPLLARLVAGHAAPEIHVVVLGGAPTPALLADLDVLPPRASTWVSLELRRESWPNLGAVLLAADDADLDVSVVLATEPARARLDTFPAALLDEVLTSLRRQHTTLDGRLRRNRPTWRLTLARLEHVAAQARARDEVQVEPPDLSLAGAFGAVAALDDRAVTPEQLETTAHGDDDGLVLHGLFRCDLDDRISWSSPTVLGIPSERCVGRSFYELGVALDEALGVGRAGTPRKARRDGCLWWQVPYPTFPRPTLVEAVTVPERATDGRLLGTYTHAVARRDAGELAGGEEV